MRQPLPVLGWKEQGSLPELGVRRLRMKLDTGARSSALHVEELRTIGEHELDGETFPILRFAVLVGSREQPRRTWVEVPAEGWKIVRDTGAKAEKRPGIRTRVVCGPLDTIADVTITSRHGMNFRMLLGRLTLAGHCTVDPMRGYLHSPTPPRRKGR